MYFDIKAVPFKYCTPSVCCADCWDSMPQSRGDSFHVHCVYACYIIATTLNACIPAVRYCILKLSMNKS